MQASIVKFVPELDCKYSYYPMAYDRWWAPNETAPDGQPCYVAATAGNNSSTIQKEGYVYGPGLYGPGYYHVLTKSAHVAIFSKFMQVPPPGGGCCVNPRTSNLPEVKEWDDVRMILHARTRAGAAHDGKAQTAQMNEAMGMAVSMGQVYFHNPRDRDEVLADRQKKNKQQQQQQDEQRPGGL